MGSGIFTEAMTTFAHIIEDSPSSLWGLSARERLRRQLARAGVDLIDDLEALSEGDTAVLLRGDYLYDDRVIKGLAESTNTLLRIQGKPVAAHVPAAIVRPACEVIRAEAEDLPGTRTQTPQTLTSAYQEQLRKAEPPFVLPVTLANRRTLERRLFAGSYKGVTDLVTKWLWPRPAEWATRWCVRFGLRPNQVTWASVVLVVLAGLLFAQGHYGWGLAAGWLMTFLDTVDGKLARVTLTSSRFGHALDHGLDIVHPPLWYLAWGLGLEQFEPDLAWLSLDVILGLIVGGYVVGRLIEGAFQLWLGRFGIFSWRPLDSYFRLITARRNPNLILLTAATLLGGRPDLGLLAVAGWTVVTSLFLLLRLLYAWRERILHGPLHSWLAHPESLTSRAPLAVRLFAGRTVQPSGGHE